MRISTKDAAQMLGLPEQSLRCWMQKGCPFGEVIIDRHGKFGRRTYFICKERLEAYLRGETGVKE